MEKRLSWEQFKEKCDRIEQEKIDEAINKWKNCENYKKHV